MDAAASDLGRVTGGEQRLRLALSDVSDADVVLIDCPGALSVVTVAAMVAATSVLTVTAPTAKELAGVPRLEDTIAEVQQAYNPGLGSDWDRALHRAFELGPAVYPGFGAAPR